MKTCQILSLSSVHARSIDFWLLLCFGRKAKTTISSGRTIRDRRNWCQNEYTHAEKWEPTSDGKLDANKGDQFWLILFSANTFWMEKRIVRCTQISFHFDLIRFHINSFAHHCELWFSYPNMLMGFQHEYWINLFFALSLSRSLSFSVLKMFTCFFSIYLNPWFNRIALR